MFKKVSNPAEKKSSEHIGQREAFLGYHGGWNTISIIHKRLSKLKDQQNDPAKHLMKGLANALVVPHFPLKLWLKNK